MSLLVLGSCYEYMQEPVITETFIKLYGDIYPMTAVDAKPHPDGGYLLLANAEFPIDEGTAFMQKLIKINEGGYEEWETALEHGRNEVSYALELTPNNSYLIAGKYINGDKEEFMLAETNQNGEILNRFTKTFAENSAARAVHVRSNGNYFVVGTVGNDKVRSYALELAPDFTEISSQLFDDNSKISIATTLVENNQGQMFWAGTVDHGAMKKANLTGYTPPGLVEADDEFPKDNTQFDLKTFMSPSENNFVFLGTTPSGDQTDLDFLYASSSGQLISRSTFPGVGNDVPVSVARASDGGFLALSKSESNRAGYGTDFMLLKIVPEGSGAVNIFGDRLYFGGQNDDTPATVLTTPDGGILMYGHTNFANANILIVYKVKVNGGFN